MLGSIIGDIAGSRFEFNNYRNTDFDLFSNECYYTDDTILTIAVADAIINKSDFGASILKYAKSFKCPMGGYGAMFNQWINSKSHEPYNSFGNGSAMRVGSCAILANSRTQALQYAALSSIPTHNHPEGIKGAMAITDAAWYAMRGFSKKSIKTLIENVYGYDLGKRPQSIRKSNTFNETCQITVPHAIISFLAGNSFEDCIKTAISLGGDSDTIAAMTGTIAEAFYGIPTEIASTALSYLPSSFIEIINKVYNGKS